MLKRCLALPLLALTTAAIAQGPLTPEAVRADLQAAGAKAAVETLVRDGRWDAVTDHMAKGEAAWIALAPELAAGSDAGTSEDLGVALALALSRNAPVVLAAIDPQDGPVLGVSRVCGRPFIEDGEPRNYKAKAIRALRAVKAPGLAASVRACLHALEA